MNFNELKQFIIQRKNETNCYGIEFKRNWSRECGQDISAIANEVNIETGWLVIGIEDNGKLGGKNERRRNIGTFIETSWY